MEFVNKQSLKYDAILFDLDGTIIDSSPGIISCFCNTLQVLGINEPDRKTLLSIVGPPLQKSFCDLFGMNTKDADNAVKIFRREYSDSGLYESTPYSGITTLLQTLCDHNIYLAIATSKPKVFADRILSHHNMDMYFTKICGTGMSKRAETKLELIKKSLPEHYLNAVMVGDRKYDIESAKEAGLPCIAVSYGYAPEGELEKAQPTAIADSPTELLELLNRYK
jgi:phosphoglycolate phosphatase